MDRQPDAIEAAVSAALPVIATRNIQGDSLAGFKKPFQRFVMASIVEPQRCRQSLRQLVPHVSTLDQVWLFNRAYRGQLAERSPSAIRATWLNIALTWQGLTKLWPAAPYVHDAAFVQGQWPRRRLLGDDTTRPWRFGGGAQEPDLILLIAAEAEADVEHSQRECMRLLEGVSVLWEEVGSRPAVGDRDTLGVRDGASQPRVLCRLDLDGTPLLDDKPRGGGDARPSDFLITGDPVYQDSSLLVLRRYLVHEAQFARALAAIVKQVRRDYTPAPIFDESYVASRLIGRWTNGAYVGRPIEDRYAEALSDDELRVDEFGPGARSCPFAAHIRKANPRDDVPKDQQRPILRRGIGFVREQELGLMFVCYQSSIEQQFEHIVRGWFNNPNFPRDGAGHDLIAGQNAIGTSRVRCFALDVPLQDGGLAHTQVELDVDVTTVDGGCYAITPSLTLLRRLCQ